MSSKIKGGGRAVLSQESQRAIVDLLKSLEDNGAKGNADGKAELSEHQRKHQRKKFAKRLIERHERLQMRRKYRAAPSDIGSGPGGAADRRPASARSPAMSPSPVRGGLNVRVELAEAIFDKKKSDKKSKEKKKKGDGGGKKATKKKRPGDERDFAVGARKVVVLPRATTIVDLLRKVAKSKLKLKKAPIRAFVAAEGGSEPFDLDGDLSPLADGTVVYVTISPPPSPPEEGEGDDAGDDDGAVVEDPVVDPLESVKRAYRNQESHRRPSSRAMKRIAEVVDERKRSSLAAARSRLPMTSFRGKIASVVRDHKVTVLSGATGSGKSTQVPQFLLESEPLDPARPYIVVAQPRRVAAISLAGRVAEERGCPSPGERGSSVGYIVRSDRRADLRSCRIIYVTIGILLRMLVNRESGGGKGRPSGSTEGGDEDDDFVPPLSIDSISHLVIDETHERDVNTDFSLALLRGMLSSSTRPYVPRLVLMSATASIDLFASYFRTSGNVEPATIEVPGKTFPVDVRWLGECEKFSMKRMKKRSGYGGGGGGEALKSDNERSNADTNKGINLSPRSTESIDDEFVRSLVASIVREQVSEGLLDDAATDGERRSTGAVLVFLPGMREIDSLARCLSDRGGIDGRGSDVCKVMKLHSTTPKAEQRRVFVPATRGTDISHVIDTCRVKESRYNSSTRIKELVTVWTSHASMKQRAGRAGRTSSGVCWRLCPEDFAENHLLAHTVPEMARTPLDELILQIGLLYEQRRDECNNNSRSDGDGGEKRPELPPGFRPIKFLSSTLTPPSERSLVQASDHLLEVEALRVVQCGPSPGDKLEWQYRLTPLGYHLSRLPMDAKVGKMLIVGCLLGCLDNALTIAAALSCSKSCFLPAFSGNKSIDSDFVDARDSLIENGFGGKDWPGGTVKGDLIAVVAAYRAWKTERNKGKFSRCHALNNTVLHDMDTLRRQFYDLLVDAGLVSSSSDSDDCNIAKEDALLTSCCIVGGLYPNVCTLIRPGERGPKGGRFLTNESNVACRPSSNSFQRQRVQNASTKGPDVYAVYFSKHRSLGTVSPGQKRPPETFLSEVNFVSKFALLLFGGELELVKNAIIVDEWLKFKVVDSEDQTDKLNAVLILTLRELLDRVIVEHVVETFSPPDEKTIMIERHRRIIAVVRKVLSDEG
ncbi:hypothetical protein ACHAWF_012127 [Thalassiosira exigua]